MARKLFEKQAIRRRTGALANGVALKAYTDEAGTVLADISATSGGSAITGSTVTTADIAGLGPASLRFWGPSDGTDTLYLRVPSDTSLGVQKIEADPDPRLDALEAGGGGGGIAATIFDAKGDLIAATAADTAARLAAGANDTVLTADSTASTGLKWATPASGSGIAATLVDAKGDLIAASAADTVARLAVGAADSKLTPDSTQTTGLRWQVNEGPRNPMSAVYGAVGDGTTDDTAAFTALLASFGSRGGEIELPPRVFRIPGGVTSSLHGMVVRGLGHRHLNTSVTADTTGAVIVAETAGAWCWTHSNSTGGTSNDYRGPRFEEVTFAGDAGTAGGLRIAKASATVQDCTATGHTTGKGFYVDPDALGAVAADDTSWVSMFSCVAQNCLTGFDINCGAELIGDFTLKTTAGGIAHTGTGFLLRGGNISVLGGKAEGEADGWLITSTDGVYICGAKAENNTRGYYLNRPSLPGFSSRLRLVACHASATNTTSFQVGANQQNDMLIGCGMATDVVDGGANTVILGTAAANLSIRKSVGGQKALSMGVGAAETGALLPQTGGTDLDVSMVTNGKIHAKLGSADANSYFGIRDSADVILWKLFGTGQMSIRRSGDTFDRINLEPVGRALNLGSGSGATDVNLYRSAADVLATDDRLSVALGVQALPQTAPSTPASGAVLYVDTADSQVKIKKADGTIIVLG